ncbi:MAG: transposase [Candidatus Latescibacterota bacterium]|nr:MAG: transposase [Candidatus Latescibacterota bacterium]
MKITLKCKLNPSEEQGQILDHTLGECLKAANYVSHIAWERKCFNRVALHHLVYREIREKFGLTAQIAVAVKDRVAFSYKANREHIHIFRKPFLPLNPPRSFRLIGEEVASISTLKGRQKIPLLLGRYQKRWLEDRAKKICESLVVKRGQDYFLHLTIEVEEPPPKDPQGFLGVDLGINNLAYTSEGESFSGREVEGARLRYERLRAELQQKGTWSAKRKLKRLSGKERRFKRNINHLISRRIVDKALATGRALVLEALKGIGERAKHRKSQNGRFHKWAFGELRRFIVYKAQLAGVQVFFAPPAYTSQRCPVCGYTAKHNRPSQGKFLCRVCGFSDHADHVGALNLVWVAVSRPDVLRPARGSGRTSCRL